jgi:hypothetical protein
VAFDPGDSGRWALSCDGSVAVEFKTNRKGYYVQPTKLVHISIGSLGPSTHARSGRALYSGAQFGSGSVVRLASLAADAERYLRMDIL